MTRCKAFSPNYAAPSALLPNNPTFGIFLVVFAIGLAVFLFGTAVVRWERKRVVSVTDVFGIALDAAHLESVLARELKIIERLTVIGEPWCVQELNTLRSETLDPYVRNMADDALLVIGAR